MLAHLINKETRPKKFQFLSKETQIEERLISKREKEIPEECGEEKREENSQLIEQK